MQKHEVNMIKEEKRGQTTIFIILGLIIIVAAVLVYFLFPGIKSGFVTQQESPAQFIQNCLEEPITQAVEELSIHGGSISPTHYILYQGDSIEYLCYTDVYYDKCTVQRPLLERHIESEIINAIKEKADKCFDDVEQAYRDKGYEETLRRGEMNVELLPKRVVVEFHNSMKLSRGGEETTYDSFRVVLDNNIYELASIAGSIIEWETKYGDAETTAYMTYYKDLKVEKKKQLDGSTIYILTDRNNGNKFQFASRSMVWPPGYLG